MRAFLELGIILTSAALSSGVLSAGAKEPRKLTLPKGPPAEQIRALIAQHERAMTAFRKLYDAAKTDAEQEKLESQFPDPQPYADVLLRIAKENPKDAAVVDALVWAFRNTRSSEAKELLMRDHLLHANIGPLCLALRHERDANSYNALTKVLNENPSKEAQAHAAVAMAIRLKTQMKLAQALQKADEKVLGKWEKSLGKEQVLSLRKANAATIRSQAEELLERVTKDEIYARTMIDYGEDRITLAKLASRELFELRYLEPGKRAPDIIGEDIDGKPMKLSDFRGKVVLLDFWGFW